MENKRNWEKVIMEIATQRQNIFKKLFFITIAVSSIVFLEPAPYDLLMLIVIFTALLSGYIVFMQVHFWPVLCILLFLMTNFISLYFVRDVYLAVQYLLITVYCLVAWTGVAGISYYSGKKLLPILFNSYVAAALFVVVPGIVAYQYPGTILDIFLWGGDRLKGLFKDPNVFGPFLIPPALYAVWKLSKSKQSKKAFVGWTIVFLLLSIGILLSFSRAAWGQFILTLGICFLIINDRSTKRLKTLSILTLIIVPVLMYIVLTTDIGALFYERTNLKAYDAVRFQEQGDSIQYVLSYPLGFGPGQSEYFLNQSTHNLFIRILSENGLLGLGFFLLFWLLTLFRSIQINKCIKDSYKGYFVIVTACLIGIFFNSLFIDSMHWRHFWLLLALPWMSLDGSTITDKE